MEDLRTNCDIQKFVTLALFYWLEIYVFYLCILIKEASNNIYVYYLSSLIKIPDAL
jgi:cell shape-determining protein MreD